MIGRAATAFLLLSTLFLAVPIDANQDAFAKARELYVTADYEGALAVLDRLEDEGGGLEIADYRLFCLLALERSDEARQTIAAILEADPFHQLSETQASPRMLTTFQATRKALLPDIVQHLYADAKALLDKHDPTATARFDRLIALLDDPDLKSAPISDLRAVAMGFRDLSESAKVRLKPDGTTDNGTATDDSAVRLKAGDTTDNGTATDNDTVRLKPDATSVAPPVVLPLTGPPDTIRVSSRGASPVFTPKSPPPPGLEPPLPISQPFPDWSPRRNAAPQTYHGILEVTIDEHGTVTTVALQQAIQPAFDQALLKAARKWKYQPALLNGTPVPFVKVIEIQIPSEP